jgi:hypothetical protein
MGWKHRKPDVLNRARTVDVGQGCGRLARDIDRRRNFQVRPSSRDGTLPVPSVAMPALPLAPVKFSALIERVSALERRERLPIWLPNPSKQKSIFASCWSVLRAQFNLTY